MIVFMGVLGVITAFAGALVLSTSKGVFQEAVGSILWIGGITTVVVAVVGYKIVERLVVLQGSLAVLKSSEPASAPVALPPLTQPAAPSAPPAASISTEPTVVSTRTHLGIYYAIMSDGTIRVRTKGGDYDFASVEAFKENLQANRAWWAQQAGRQV